VYSKGGSGKAASGRVLKYENQKGYAAALWAYKNGITDPGVFDRMTEAEKVDFMNGRTNPETGELEPGAIQHAKEMNNPAPKGPKYQVNTDTGTILGENTLEFAKAHLRKLVADGGPRPATAPETVERLRGAAGEPTAAETVEGMRPEPPSLLQQVGEALKEETGSVGPGSGASKELRQALREKARTTVERLRDYTRLLPPPEGERVSPLRAGMQDYPEAGTATRGKGSAVIDFLRRKMEREAGVGGPQNERRVFKDANGSIAVGKITNGDWWKRAQENLSPDELRQAREWYSSLENFFRQHFGEEKAPRMALAWLLANQNTSPSGAMLNVLRAIDLEAGKARIKSAGLAEEKIHQAIQGDLVKSGFGPKLSDFVDSALGKFTRTWMGDDPRGGRPAVIDIWANRDVGKVDTPLYNYLKDRFGEKAVQDLKVDGKSIGETQYEHGSEFYNKLTDYLNKRTIDGGNWTPAEAQAVGWVAMQKAMGKMPEFPADIITKNARRVSLSAEPAEGSPLQNAGHTTIPPEHMRYIVDQAAQKSGVKLLRQENASGAVHHTVFGSPESIQDFADMVGHGAQQSSVTATRPLKSGKAFALDVMHQPGESALSNEAEANDLVSKLRAALPENLKPMADQVQPFTDGNGNAGLRFLKSRGTWNADNIQTFADTLGSVAADKPYALDVHPGKIDLIESGHDWQASPDGQSYLTSLTNRGRVQEAQWLQHELRPAVEARLQSQSAGQATRRQASSAGNKPEAPAQAVSEPARVTVERLRKAGKNIMSAVKDETGSIGPGSGAKAELLQSLRSEILRWYQSYNKAFSDDAADAIMRKEILPRFQQFTAALDELKQSGVSPERLRQYTQGIFPDEPPSEPEPRGTFIIEGQMKPGGKWRDVGEGPWETHSEAHRYGEAEVGIPWRVREKGKPFAAPRKK
jgi:hypothetical protein